MREPAYGHTYGQPPGNRVVEGERRSPESRPVDARLGGEPLRVAGVPLEADVAPTWPSKAAVSKPRLVAGPFGPGGELEIAATGTPHTGAEIEFYKPRPRSRDAGGLDGAWELLVPKESYTEPATVRRAESGAVVAWTLPLSCTLATNLLASATGPSGRISVAAGRADGLLRVWR